eukprot:6192867-Pleurochrysis_carterae.AAC.1
MKVVDARRTSTALSCFSDFTASTERVPFIDPSMMGGAAFRRTTLRRSCCSQSSSAAAAPDTCHTRAKCCARAR